MFYFHRWLGGTGGSGTTVVNVTIVGEPDLGLTEGQEVVALADGQETALPLLETSEAFAIGEISESLDLAENENIRIVVDKETLVGI